MTDPYGLEPTPIDFRRPRLAGDVLSDAIAFVRDHFVDLGRGLLYIAGPAVVVLALVSAYFQQQVVDSAFVFDPATGGDPGDVFSFFGPAYFLTIGLGMVVYTLVQAVGYAYVFLYMEDVPGPIGVAELWAETKRLLLPIFLASTGLFLLIAASALLNIIPCLGTLVWIGGWIYLFPAASLLVPARIIDEGDFFSAFRRARHLVDGYWAQTFGLLILVYVVMFVLGIVLAMPSIVLGFVTGFFGGGGADAVAQSIATLSSVLGAVSYLAYAFIPVALAMHYFNLVTKQEGAHVPDLEARIGAIGRDEPETSWDEPGADPDSDDRWSGRGDGNTEGEPDDTRWSGAAGEQRDDERWSGRGGDAGRRG